MTGVPPRRCSRLAEQEERSLKPLANDRGKGEEAESQHRCRGDCAINATAKIGAEGDGLLAHPEEHVGEDHHGKERGGASDDLLGGPLQAPEGHECNRAHCGGGEDGSGDAKPEAAESIGAADLYEVARNDANDECRFDPFTKSGE